jgi:hypothetical protein
VQVAARGSRCSQVRAVASGCTGSSVRAAIPTGTVIDRSAAASGAGSAAAASNASASPAPYPRHALASSSPSQRGDPARAAATAAATPPSRT